MLRRLFLLLACAMAWAWAAAAVAAAELPGERVLAPESLREWPLVAAGVPLPFVLEIHREEGWLGGFRKEIAGEGDVFLRGLYVSAGDLLRWTTTGGGQTRSGALVVASDAERAAMEKALAAIDGDRQTNDGQRRALRIAALQQAGYQLDAAREAGTLQPARASAVPAGWRDCDACPELVTVPAGRMTLDADAPSGEQQPRITVAFPRVFAIAKRETTLGEYRYFLRRTGYLPRDEWMAATKALPDDLPVTGLWVPEIQAYLRWLRRHTGKPYRLPGDYEWEYVARAGAATGYWWGNDDAGACGREWVRHSPYSMDGNCGSARSVLMPAGGLPANPFGVHDIYGNAEEFVLCAPGVAACTGGVGAQAGLLYRPGTRASSAWGAHDFSGFRVARGLP